MPISSVNGDAGNTKWKRHREGVGQNLKTAQKRFNEENMYRGNSGEILWTTDPVYRNACFKHANVQSKAVFSFAMKTMDETCGWEDEEKRVGSEIRRMHVDLHQRGADKRTNTHSGNGAVLKETNDVHYAMHEMGLCWYFR